MTHIALLRAINLAGRNAVSMGSLRTLVEELGFKDVRSLLQSGNLVFRSPKRTRAGDEIEQALEAATAQRLGVQTDFLVRTAEEWAALVAANPFPDAAANDPGHLLAMPLKAAPAPHHLESLRNAVAGRELIGLQGRTAYFVYPDGIGRSRLTHVLIEKKLGSRGTARNWNTVLKIAALAAGVPA